MIASGFGHLVEHVRLAFSSVFAQVFLISFVAIVGVVLLQFGWKSVWERRNKSGGDAHSRSKQRQTTQIGYEKSAPGKVVYWVVVAFAAYSYVVLLLCIVVMVGKPV